MIRFLLIPLILLSMIPFAQAEVVEADFAKVIPVRLQPNKARQVVFSLPLDRVERRKDSGLSVRVPADVKDMMVVDAAMLIAPQDVFVTDIEGNRYHLRFEMVKEPQDAMLFVQDGRTDTTRYAEVVKETPLTDLLIAMAGDRRLDGYGVQDFKGELPTHARGDGLGFIGHRLT